MVLDAKKAHLHAWAERDLFIELPTEAGGGCARLIRSLYGTRDAPALWEAYAAVQLTALGFRRGRSNACVYWHPQRRLRCLVHGDDFVVTGAGRHLEWLHQALARTILLKKVGVLGLDMAGGDSQEVWVLNRVLRVSAAGVQYEADPRHAEILAALLAPATHPLSTPGVRETFGTPAASPDTSVFSLGDACGRHGTGWSSEEEEEQEGEGQKAAAQEEEEGRSASRARP